MAKELTVNLKNIPGQLGWLGHILGEAGVNIIAIAGNSDHGSTFVRFIPDKAEKACAALLENDWREISNSGCNSVI